MPLWLGPDDHPVVVEGLRQRARRDWASYVPIDSVDAERRRIFLHAINNVLATELAVDTYAQIIDGLPTEAVASRVGTTDRPFRSLLPPVR